MPRVAGVDIPNEKRFDIALTAIYGVGPDHRREGCDVRTDRPGLQSP